MGAVGLRNVTNENISENLPNLSEPIRQGFIFTEHFVGFKKGGGDNLVC